VNLYLVRGGGLHKHVVAETTATASQTFAQVLTALATNGGTKLLNATVNHYNTLVLEVPYDNTKMVYKAQYMAQDGSVSFSYNSGSSTVVTTNIMRLYYSSGAINNAIYVLLRVDNTNATTFVNSSSSEIGSHYTGNWQIYYLD